MQVAVTCSLTASLKGARISSMLPSMVVRSSAGSSHLIVFLLFLQKRADVQNGRFLGGWRSDCRTKRTVAGRQDEEISALVLSSADAALRRSMDRRRMMKSSGTSKCSCGVRVSTFATIAHAKTRIKNTNLKIYIFSSLTCFNYDFTSLNFSVIVS